MMMILEEIAEVVLITGHLLYALALTLVWSTNMGSPEVERVKENLNVHWAVLVISASLLVIAGTFD